MLAQPQAASHTKKSFLPVLLRVICSVLELLERARRVRWGSGKGSPDAFRGLLERHQRGELLRRQGDAEGCGAYVPGGWDDRLRGRAARGPGTSWAGSICRGLYNACQGLARPGRLIGKPSCYPFPIFTLSSPCPRRSPRTSSGTASGLCHLVPRGGRELRTIADDPSSRHPDQCCGSVGQLGSKPPPSPAGSLPRPRCGLPSTGRVGSLVGRASFPSVARPLPPIRWLFSNICKRHSQRYPSLPGCPN
jgi:hypothetical protein